MPFIDYYANELKMLTTIHIFQNTPSPTITHEPYFKNKHPRGGETKQRQKAIGISPLELFLSSPQTLSYFKGVSGILT
jgi:hypothetical protein